MSGGYRMRYLKPRGIPIEVNGKLHHIKFTLDLIDELQTRTGIPMSKLIYMLGHDEYYKDITKLTILQAIGEMVEDKEELSHIRILLIKAWIEQFKFKGIEDEKPNSKEDPEHELIDIECLFYIGTVQLGFSQSEVWGMTLGQILTLTNQDAIYKGLKKEDKEVSIDDVIPY